MAYGGADMRHTLPEGALGARANRAAQSLGREQRLPGGGGDGRVPGRQPPKEEEWEGELHARQQRWAPFDRPSSPSCSNFGHITQPKSRGHAL